MSGIHSQLLTSFLTIICHCIFMKKMYLFQYDIISNIQPAIKVVYYDNELGMDGSIDSSVGHHSFNCENKLSRGAEILGKIRAHLLNVGYSKFHFLK